MPDNLIRGKQLYKPDVTGIVQEVIDSNQFQLTYQGGTGININNISAISISGTTINFFASAISGDGTGYFSDLFVDGQSVLTAGTAVSATTLSNTGAALNNYINNLSGLSVLTYGNQNITGNKNFTSDVNVSGNLTVSGNRVLTGVSFISLLNDNQVVFTTGNQTISGNKTFTSDINLVSGTSGRSLRIFNTTGALNSGEFALMGWRDNQFIIGPDRGNTGVLRDLVLTGGNIIINASGLCNILDSTNISGQFLRLNNSGVVLSGEFLNGTIILGHQNQTPANGGQTYYFSKQYYYQPVVNTNDRRFSVPRNCTVRSYSLEVATMGTYGQGTPINVTYDVYNTTTATSVGTLFTCVGCNIYTGQAGGSPYTGVFANRTNIPLLSGQWYAIRWVYGGGFGVPATSVNNVVTLYVE